MLAAVPPASALAVPLTRPLLVSCRVVIRMPDGSRGEHEGMYPNLDVAIDRAIELFPEAEVIAFARAFGRKQRRAASEHVPVQQLPPSCNELGLCQAQFGRPRCKECDYEGDGKPLELAPGVIDGPYCRPSKARQWAQIVRKNAGLVVGYLKGPHP